ncbi:hypothetical protein [Mycobacterium sp.]|uniref:hypothetical protein n=1 Tax=Mycobacterium sp. TaxID=1785 RepID=UPI003A8589FB
MIEKLLGILQGELGEDTIADLVEHKDAIASAIQELIDTNTDKKETDSKFDSIISLLNPSEEPKEEESIDDVLSSIAEGEEDE